jgi:hypothetical protein
MIPDLGESPVADRISKKWWVNDPKTSEDLFKNAILSDVLTQVRALEASNLKLTNELREVAMNLKDARRAKSAKAVWDVLDKLESELNLGSQGRE